MQLATKDLHVRARWSARLSVGALAGFLFFSFGLFAQDRPDFSGLYVRTSSEPPLRHGQKSPPTQLKVVRNGRVLDVVFSEEGKTRSATYYLDGTESENLTSGGAISKDRVKVTKKGLAIDSLVLVPVVGTTLQMKQKWQLSRDSRHLTIQTTASAASGAAAGFPVWSGEEVYTRQP